MATRGTVLVNPGTGSVVFPSSTITFPGTVAATLFSGIGTSLTQLDGSQISQGTIPNARLDSDLQSFITNATWTGPAALTFAVDLDLGTKDLITDGDLACNILSVDTITATGSVDFQGTATSSTKVVVGGAKGFASSGALQAGTPDYAGQLCFVTGSFAWSVATGTGAGDTDGDTVCLNSLVYFTAINSGPTATGALNSVSQTANFNGQLNHYLASSGQADNTLYLKAGNTTSHSGISILRSTDAWPGVGSVAMGGSGVSAGYADRMFIATNPPAATPSADPPDILISLETQDGAPNNQHHKLLFDGTSHDTTCYGWSTSSETGQIGWNVAADGRMGVFTSSLYSGAQLTVAGHIALTGATRNEINFGTTGVAAPGAGTNGCKLALYTGSITPVSTDYMIGVEAGAIWLNSDAIRFYNNASLIFSVEGTTGDIRVTKTITAGGTTGAQTINKASGTVNLAASATSLVVTNSLVTTNSRIFLNIATNDASSFELRAVAASGSFTIHVKGTAPAAETRVDFLVLN